MSDLLKWFSISWWKYLFEEKNSRQKNYGISRLKMIICKIKNHPNGCIYFNPNGLEPDDHCQDCYEEL